MKTQLIILPDYNIIVSDEKPKEKEWCLNPNGFVDIFGSDYGAVFTEEQISECKKVIASDNPKHNLPSIDYNGLEEYPEVVDKRIK